MIIFLAGPTRKDLEQKICEGYPARLRTYADIRRGDRNQRNPILFLDSGAFTFQRTGEVVPLETYAQFVLDYKADISASMDVIGDPIQSDKNFRTLKRLGAPVVPVIHAGWPTKMIEQYVEENEFILAGGMVPLAKYPEKLYGYLNLIFKTARKHWPRRVHAFGITGLTILERYPFYSADSSAWIAFSKFGRSLSGDTPLNRYITETQRNHMKLWQEVEFMRDRAKFLTDLWRRRGIEWNDELSVRAESFYGGRHVGGQGQVQGG